ncbi:MAG: DUF2269 family protein [Chloroflexi bacterium]|nr:MAG: DUF2269 family protein [Chloroflexota bacterium]
MGRGRGRQADHNRNRYRAGGHLMFSLYVVLKFIHVLSAITAVGANITYGVWNARSQADPAHLGFTLKGIKFLDDRIANPAYGVLLLTGLVMVFVNRWPITSLWIILALVLFAILGVLAVAVYTPLLRDLIKLVDAGDTSSPEFSRLSGRNRIMGPAFGVIVVLILVMMVFKPTL